MVLHLGVSGAALATVSGQTVSASMSIYFFFFRKDRSYQIKASFFRPDGSIIREVLLIGLPSFLKSISASLVVIVTNNLLKVMGGDSALGVYAIVGRLYSALTIPQAGIIQGMQPLVGYNFGQKRFERVRQTIGFSLRATIGYGILVCSICWLVPATLIALLSKEPLIVSQGQVALRILSLACPLGGVSVMVAAYFQSVGRAREALMIALGGIVLVKLPVLFVGSSLFSLTGIWAAEAASELILCMLALWMLKSYQEKTAALERLSYRPQPGMSD
jgi:Na+-driven multidrug efflux pump